MTKLCLQAIPSSILIDSDDEVELEVVTVVVPIPVHMNFSCRTCLWMKKIKAMKSKILACWMMITQTELSSLSPPPPPLALSLCLFFLTCRFVLCTFMLCSFVC